MKPSRKDPKHRTAYHEAGHVVVCHRLGGEYDIASIVKRKHEQGRVVGGFPDRYLGRDEERIYRISSFPAKAEAVMCYAGRAAEALLLGESLAQAFPAVIDYGGWDESDREGAENKLRQVGALPRWRPGTSGSPFGSWVAIGTMSRW